MDVPRVIPVTGEVHVCIRFTLCVVHSVGLCKHNAVYPELSIMQGRPPARPHSPPSQPLEATSGFPVPTVVPFPECRVIGITQCADWLLSLSHTHFSFLHGFSWLGWTTVYLSVTH